MIDIRTDSVPLSRTLGCGTAGQLARTRDNKRDTSGTTPTSPFAVVHFRRTERDSTRDECGTDASRKPLRLVESVRFARARSASAKAGSQTTFKLWRSPAPTPPTTGKSSAIEGRDG